MYSVSFTTKKIVTRYGPKREILSEEVMEVPVTLHGLPASTAQAYAGCDNFQMVKDYSSSADTKVSYRKTRGGKTTREVEVIPGGRKGRAALTGDMGAALS